MIVIQLPEWENWRIAGEDLDWQIQRRYKHGGRECWKGQYFFPDLQHAVMHAYERTLRELPATVELECVVEQCREVAGKLEKAVTRALREAV